MATIEKRIGRWRAKVRKSGCSLSKTFQKKSDALQWAAETERSITLGFLHPTGKDATLGQILTRYAEQVTPLKKGANTEHHRIRLIQRHPIMPTLLSNLQPSHIAKYRDDRMKRVQAGTIRRELSVISARYYYSCICPGWNGDIPEFGIQCLVQITVVFDRSSTHCLRLCVEPGYGRRRLVDALPRSPVGVVDMAIGKIALGLKDVWGVDRGFLAFCL